MKKEEIEKLTDEQLDAKCWQTLKAIELASVLLNDLKTEAQEREKKKGV